MDTTAIKNYCTWARSELISEVRVQMGRYGIAREGAEPADAEAVGGIALTAAQCRQRAALLAQLKDRTEDDLAQRAAYTWFNRVAAIRYMEVNDYLPSHVRVLSSGVEGDARPQVLRDALSVDIEGVDSMHVAELVQAADDEALFRYLFLCQCEELASCLPDVFEPIDAAMELLLPQGLLYKDGPLMRMVSDIPEENWTEGVEIVGWMYQYYVIERKDEVFASFKKGKKAERDDIAPATQLFTPNWIVRYLTENSLGRLWMLNRPDSSLTDDMPYFVKPDEDHETEFKHVASPEDITVVDPACGSGHILVYAFELLSKMYAEAGYTARETARLILEKNLSGMEIDPRAGAMASFALTMKACELDSRFLRRGVSPRITVLSRVEFEPEELRYLPNLSARPQLLDAVAHLDECGSLLVVTKDDMDALAGDLASLAGGGTIFGGSAAEKLGRVRAELEPLSRSYDVVVANPPYMGAKNMNKWLSGWVKDNYPDVKGDLFSCFMARNSGMGSEHAQMGFMTPYVWMFIGTYKKLRRFVIEQNTITSLIQLEYSGFAGATVPICTFTLQKGKAEGYRGGYIRLSDFPGADQQAPRALEALANPNCGWFYRRDADTFRQIPGSPIAYWASDAMLEAFGRYASLESLAKPRQGLATGYNDMFLREWWEISRSAINVNRLPEGEDSPASSRWYPCNKGGGFRRWYGFNSVVIDWEDNGEKLRRYPGSVIRNPDYYFREGMSWGTISSAKLSMRYSPSGSISEHAGSMVYLNRSDPLFSVVIAAMNSSVVEKLLTFLSPSLRFTEGPVGQVPIPNCAIEGQNISRLSNSAIAISKVDYDSFETSWDFARHPLL